MAGGRSKNGAVSLSQTSKLHINYNPGIGQLIQISKPFRLIAKGVNISLTKCIKYLIL